MTNVVFISNFSGPSGSAIAARGYFKILATHPKINLKVINAKPEGARGEEPENFNSYLSKSLPESYVLLYFIEPGEQHLTSACDQTGYNIREIMQGSTKCLIFTVWECMGIPNTWRNFFNNYADEVVTHCNFQQRNLSGELNRPVNNIPYLVPVNAKGTSNNSNTGKFRILSISQWSKRKGFDIAIQAYLCEFFNHQDVELVIKTYGRFGVPNEELEIKKQIINYKANCSRLGQLPKCQIKLWVAATTSNNIDRLYDNCDLYFSPTRGEGFGLTIAEALAKGKRVLVPDQGGHLDYIHPNNYFIKSRWETMRCADWSINYSSEFKLVEPDFEDTRLQLRKAYEDFTNKKQEWANKQTVSQRFTMDYLSEDKIKSSLERVLGIK